MRRGPSCATLVVMNFMRSQTDRALLLCLSLLAMLVLGGCNKAIAPSFEAVGVRELERDGTRAVIEFTVRATNPNAEPIPLRTVSYRVLIGDEVVFEGVRSPETTLHTYSSQDFVLPAVLSQEQLHGSIEYALLGSVQYIPPGRLSEVLFDAEVKVPEAALDLRGSINAGD